MLDDLQCPRCRMTLVHCANEFGNFWACGKCEGTAVTLSLLKKFVERETLNDLWRAARDFDHVLKVECPGCNGRMEEVPLRIGSEYQKIDVCEKCQFIWLDAGEWDQLPHVPVNKEEALSQLARESLAIEEVKRIRRDSRPSNDIEQSVWDFWKSTSYDLSARAVIRLIFSLLRRDSK